MYNTKSQKPGPVSSQFGKLRSGARGAQFPLHRPCVRIMSLVYQSGDLDPHVIPAHYHITLAPRSSICVGRVVIDLDISEGFSSRSILIHADPRIGITSASIAYQNELREEVRRRCSRPKSRCLSSVSDITRRLVPDSLN